MFGWLPILGPIWDGIVFVGKSLIGSKIAESQVEIAAIDMVKTFKDDVGVRLARDIIMFPIAVWTSLITWDNIVLHVKPEWVWTVERFPPGVEYLPYAVIAFLFGMAWLNRK